MSEKEATKVYLSVPMSAKSDDRIEYALEMAKNYYLMHYPYHAKTAEFVSNYIPGEVRWTDNRKEDNKLDIDRLSRGLKLLADCDVIIFAPCGSVDYHCYLEHEACKKYDHKYVMEMTDEWRRR